MSNKILIVESPNKVATIQKIVGDKITVLATIGHILKLSTSGLNNLGIDFENWEPKMIPDPLKKSVILKLKAAVKDADEVLIATDPDREGEAIANNLITTLKIEAKYKRIKYNEITNEAIKYALENPLKIDEDLVNAQKARRMLDRIIGFRLSELMKSKVKNAPTNPSAGRVQSIALKLVCDRENEIAEFNPILYSKITASLGIGLDAMLYLKTNDKDFEDNTWINRDKAFEIFSELQNSDKKIIVNNISISKRTEAAYVPFKQSVLYKEAKYSSKVVQASAQKLFETGLISYPRTDSTRLSETFITKARKYIEEKFGDVYIAKEIKGFAGSQDAHEAIRPTNIELTPEAAKNEYSLSEIDAYIYKIIYDKTIMSLMTPPKKEVHKFDLKVKDYNFRMSFSKLIFDGYYIYSGKEDIQVIPNLNIGDILDVNDYLKEDKQTTPPSRYNEGSLIKKLDDIKVGRPSTFASTISVIKQRLFVELVDGYLVPTEFGKVVLQKLLSSFPRTINETYTALVESELDLISEGKKDYKTLMQLFWESFSSRYNDIKDRIDITTLKLNKLDEKCPNCNADLVYRYTKIRKTKFIGCSMFPKCNYIRNIEQPKRTFYKRKNNKENH